MNYSLNVVSLVHKMRISPIAVDRWTAAVNSVTRLVSELKHFRLGNFELIDLLRTVTGKKKLGH